MADEGFIVNKVWGHELWITNTPLYCAKFLNVKPGYVCSYHRHLIKDETFHVLGGSGVILVAGYAHRVTTGQTVHIPTGEPHCFASIKGMTLLEISTQHSDADVQRYGESHSLDWSTDTVLLLAMGLKMGEPLESEGGTDVA